MMENHGKFYEQVTTILEGPMFTSMIIGKKGKYCSIVN